MGIYAIHYTYPDDPTEMLGVRPEHREWLTSVPGLLAGGMYKEGRDEVSEGEPTIEEPLNGALIVLAADSIGEVTELLDHDPYWENGFILRRVVRQWDPPFGPWVADATQSPG